MQVLFLTLYPPAAASARYRVLQFLPALAQAGVTSTVAGAVDETIWLARPRRAWRYHLQESMRRREHLKLVYHHDVVFVQKALTSAPVRGILAPLLECRDRVVYDIDDAVHRFSPDHLPRGMRWLEEEHPQGQTLMRVARMTLAGNAWLEEECTGLGGRPRPMPTVVDTEKFHPMPQPDDVYRLGWIGSPSTASALAEIADAVRGEEILVVGAGATQLPLEAAREAWSLEGELEQITHMSVGLMPLQKDMWSLGKCALKALLYMACGRPVIATPWGAAKDVVLHGETGLLADTTEEWRAAIGRLRDPAERARMGANARTHVERNYSLKVWAPRMVQYLREVA